LSVLNEDVVNWATLLTFLGLLCLFFLDRNLCFINNINIFQIMLNQITYFILALWWRVRYVDLLLRALNEVCLNFNLFEGFSETLWLQWNLFITNTYLFNIFNLFCFCIFIWCFYFRLDLLFSLLKFFLSSLCALHLEISAA